MRLSLTDTNSDLLKEWDYTRNSINPSEVTNGSHKKVWWRCLINSNHVWQSVIRNRVKGSLCPYCSGKKATLENCLATLKPEIAAEWHPSLNKDLTAYDVTVGSAKKVWWKCNKNSEHVWESVIQNRVTNTNCPFCAKKKASYEHCLANMNPRVSSEWHPTLNKPLTPSDVTPNSSKKVWWICKNNPNHEWEATIYNRAKGSNCPYCMAYSQTSFPELAIFYYVSLFFKDTKNRYSLDGTELDVFIPHLKIAIEYDGWFYHKGLENKDYEKSKRITDYGLTLIRIREKPLKLIKGFGVINLQVNRSSGKDTNRMIKELLNLISNNFEVDDETRGKINQFEFDVVEDNIKIQNQIDLIRRKVSLSSNFPQISNEWHPTLNGKLTPEHVQAGSSISVWWICQKNSKHVWKAVIYNRVKGDGCPYCSNKKVTIDNCLLTTHSHLAIQWHPTLNKDLTPNDVTSGSHKSVWWQCTKNSNHVWKAVIKSRLRAEKNNCPFCLGKRVSKDNCLETINPKLAKEWHPTLNERLPSEFTAGSSKKVWWICSVNENHTWEATIYNRNKGDGCPYCSGKKVSHENSLERVYPSIAEEWHPTLNGELKPSGFLAKSQKRIWWKCHRNYNHVWEATIASRVHSGSNCPFCAGRKAAKDNCLATLYPYISEEWHYLLNEGLTPFDVTHGSKKKIWWQCRENKNHVWRTTVNNRVANNSRCPHCSKKQKNITKMET